MFKTKPTVEEGHFRVIRHPTEDEWGEYEILDPHGRVVESRHDLREALVDCDYMNEHLRKLHAAA